MEHKKNLKNNFITKTVMGILLAAIIIIGLIKINNMRLEKKLVYYVPVTNIVIFPNLQYTLSMPKNDNTQIYVNTILKAYATKSPLFIVLRNETSMLLEQHGTLCDITHLINEANQVIFQFKATKILWAPKISKSIVHEKTSEIAQIKTQKFAITQGNEQENLQLAITIKQTIDASEIYKKWFGKQTLDTLSLLIKNKDFSTFSNIVSHLPHLTSKQEQGILSQNHLTKKLEYNLFYLKKQNSTIQEATPITVPHDMNDLDYILNRLENLPLPKDVKVKAMEEFQKLKSLPSGHHEKPISQKFLEYIILLPWDEPARKQINLNELLVHATTTLSESHHGLNDIKERVIEYLAISDRLKNKKAPILCLMGPPGVGKTSIAKSLAKAIHRPFVKMALGGVRDEAAIRGHLRTYVAAMPGGIMQQMLAAKVKNPVFLLDEIDKLETHSMQGDPTAALLEVLDPEQNKHFTDHYLGFEYDLSQVLFIATANTLETIPRPLLDRLEIIELSSYTVEEKIHIAQEFLLPKILDNLNVKPVLAPLTKEQLSLLVKGYTAEAGVRELERVIEKLIRKKITTLLKTSVNTSSTITIDPVTNLEIQEFLGVAMEGMDTLRMNTMNGHFLTPGVVNGLVVTSIGGYVMPIEVMINKGSGQIKQTGRLGDVMKESISVAQSVIRGLEGKFGLSSKIMAKNVDIHIHMPSGAMPKDGPSAGVTLVTAMISAYTKTPMRSDLAMTGEISLSGLVLPIGGVKEKLLAAHRAGIKTVIFPIGNKIHLEKEKISQEVLKELNIIYATHITDVLKVAFQKN